MQELRRKREEEAKKRADEKAQNAEGDKDSD